MQAIILQFALRIYSIIFEPNNLLCGFTSNFNLAERLPKKGVKVIAACLKEESVAQLQEMEDDNLIPVQMDVSNVNSIQQAYEIIINAHPHVQHGECIHLPLLHFI